MDQPRVYLYVSPEEYAEVEASGACWDDAAKSWYIGEGMASAVFSRWLGEGTEEAGFVITSEEAFVASARVACATCSEDIEVICIYCESGVDMETGDPLSRFTVSDIFGVGGALLEAIRPWPLFRQGGGEFAESGDGTFANYCPHCGDRQDDYLLHSEPGDVFFGIALGRAVGVTFTRVEGRIEVSGDYGFEV